MAAFVVVVVATARHLRLIQQIHLNVCCMTMSFLLSFFASDSVNFIFRRTRLWRDRCYVYLLKCVVHTYAAMNRIREIISRWYARARVCASAQTHISFCMIFLKKFWTLLCQMETLSAMYIVHCRLYTTLSMGTHTLEFSAELIHFGFWKRKWRREIDMIHELRPCVRYAADHFMYFFSVWAISYCLQTKNASFLYPIAVSLNANSRTMILLSTYGDLLSWRCARCG